MTGPIPRSSGPRSRGSRAATRALAGTASLLLLAPLLTGCLGDYIASGDCENLAGQLSPAIEVSLATPPTIESWGDGSMIPWCVIDVTTEEELPEGDERLTALRAVIEHGIADWPRDVAVAVHNGPGTAFAVRSPSD